MSRMSDADERLAAVYLDWWLNHPVPANADDSELEAAMEDFGSLMDVLADNGYTVVYSGDNDRPVTP